MRLKKILKNVDILDLKNFKDYSIKSITHMSQDVDKSSMFICINGNNFNGNDFALDAVEKGAKCILTQEDLELGENVTIVKVKDVRIAMSVVAKNFYNNSCDDLKIIGIIGTAGKTTTSMIIANILKSVDKNIGVIGTNGIFIGDMKLSNKFTTPDPLDLHYIFFQMKSLGVKIVIMEVSAQAIYLQKLHGVYFDKCIFTNISEEHLDFFGSMENYARCKMDFFKRDNMCECVVNVDDFYGMEIAYKTDIPCVSYAVKVPANSFALDIDVKIDRLKFVANILDEVINVDTSLVGDFNVYNLLAGMTVAKMLGVSAKTIEDAVNTMKEIPGRLNCFEKDGAKIIVDFAHTPESFEKTLSFVKKFCTNKLITLFGCVGYSDKQKRIDMGSVADKFSDSIILTTDSRGKVSFENICDDIELGIKKCKPICIEDRKNAIFQGLKLCGKGDIFCILGKGAEDFQTIGEDRIPYSDLEVVNDYLKGE